MVDRGFQKKKGVTWYIMGLSIEDKVAVHGWVSEWFNL